MNFCPPSQASQMRSLGIFWFGELVLIYPHVTSTFDFIPYWGEKQPPKALRKILHMFWQILHNTFSVLCSTFAAEIEKDIDNKKEIMKNWLKNLMVGLALIGPSYCFAEIASGTSGTCKWTISDSGLLTVEPASGNEGTLATWSDASLVPWRPYMESIKQVVVKNYVKALTCAGMFSGGINIESIDLKGRVFKVSIKICSKKCKVPMLICCYFLTI